MPQAPSLDDKYGLEPAVPAGSSDDKYGLEPANPSATAPAAPKPNFPKEAPKAEEAPGFGTRLRESLGIPTRQEAEAMVPKTLGEATKKAFEDSTFGPAKSAIEGIGGYAKRVIGDIADTDKQQNEALHNVSEGGPLIPNIAKGVEPMVKTAVRSIPFIGEPIYSAGEDFSKGNLSGGAGSLTGVIGQIALPEAIEHGAPALKAAVKKVGEPFHIGMTGEELLTKGVRPRSVAVNWDEAIARPGVQRELVEYNKNTPIKSMDDFHEAIPQIKDKIWKEQVEPALTRQKDRPVDMKPVAKAVRDTITPEMKRFEPDEATRMGNLADELERSETVGTANRLLTYVNGKLDSFFQKYPSARRANLLNNPETAGWESARQAIRKQFLDTLEAAGETQVRDARMDYGAMDTIGKEVERKVNIADRTKPWTLPRILGGLGAATAAAGGHPIVAPAVYAAGELASHLNQPNVLVRRGIARMKPAEAAPFTPPQAFTPPPAPPSVPVQQNLGLPTPEHGPLFNIEQTPRLRPDVEEARIPPISGQQVPLNIPPGPEHAPLFNEVLSAPKPAAAAPTPAPKPFVKAQVPQEGGVFKGTKENIVPVEKMGEEPPRPEASTKIPNPKAVELKPGETTEDRFFNKETNKWSPERAANHEAYIENAVKGKTAPTDRPPEAIITVGGTGAGKTTLTRRILGDNKNLVNIDPDANKLLIPEYEGLKKSDPQKAAFRVHEESSSMAKQLLQRAVQDGLDFVYDHTTGGGANSAKLYQKLKDAGYKVRIVYADLPVDEAINRARIRAESSTDPVNRGRIVPEDIIRQKHQEAANAFLKLQNHPAVDEISGYDTTTREPQQFYNRTGDKENVYSPKALERVRQKAGANAPAGKH